MGLRSGLCGCRDEDVGAPGEDHVDHIFVMQTVWLLLLEMLLLLFN